MKILNATRSEITISVDGKTIKISGEGMPPGGEVDFYADIASLRQWDDGTPVTQPQREQILRELPELALGTGFKVKFD